LPDLVVLKNTDLGHQKATAPLLVLLFLLSVAQTADVARYCWMTKQPTINCVLQFTERYKHSICTTTGPLVLILPEAVKSIAARGR